MNETTLNTRYSSDDDNDADDEINYGRIQFNESLWDALNASKSGDSQAAIQKYDSALRLIESSHDVEKICLIKSNLAILYFYQSEFKKGLTLLEECLESMKDYQRFKQNLSESASSLMVKILGNLCLMSLFMNNCEKAKNYANEFLSLISTTRDAKKKPLIEDLNQIFFKYRNSADVGDGYFEDMESKFKDESLGCFHLMMGLNREINNETKQALQYYDKSFEVWRKLHDKNFMLLAARHAFGLAHTLGDQEKITEYKSYIQQILAQEEFKNVSMDLLFKDFETKIATSKDIANSLKKLEESANQSMIVTRQDSMRKSITMKLDTINLFGEPLWKQALRLKLSNSMKVARHLKESTSVQDQEKAKHLELAILQMRRANDIISKETDPGIEEKLMNLPFVKEAVNSLRASVNRVRKFILNQTYTTAWRQLLTQRETQSRQSLLHKFQNRPSSVLNISLKTLMDGEYLDKVNYHSSGKARRFFKLCADNTLRWAYKDAHIKNPKKYHGHHLSEILGVVYGKVTDTMRKSSNKTLLPWLCFSLILKTRSVDIYAKPEQINHWVIGLSQEVKRQNPRAFVVHSGTFYWKKMKIMGVYKINEHLKLEKHRQHRTFPKAIIAFKNATNGL